MTFNKPLESSKNAVRETKKKKKKLEDCSDQRKQNQKTHDNQMQGMNAPQGKGRGRKLGMFKQIEWKGYLEKFEYGSYSK